MSSPNGNNFVLIAPTKSADLVGAIRTKLFPLGDDIAFVPGHGPMSTFGDERKNNPYVGDGAY